MPATFSIKCPECRAVLKSAKPVPAGKLITCPKCDVMFAAPKPPADDVVDDVEVIDDVDVIDDVEVIDDDKPRKGGAKPAGKRAKINTGVEVVDDDDDGPRRSFRPKRKKSTGKGAMIALMVVGGVLVLGGGGALAWYLLSGGGDNPLAYVAPESELIGGLDFVAILDSPLGPKIEPLLSSTALPFASYQKGAGGSARETMRTLVFAGGPVGANNKWGGVLVVKGNTSLDAAKLGAAFDGSSATKMGGQNMRRLTGNMPPLLYVPNKNVAVFGQDDAMVKVAASSGKGSALRKDAATLASKYEKSAAWLVFAPEESSRMTYLQGMNQQMPNVPGVKEFADSLMQAKGAAVWINIVGSDLEINIGVLANSPAAAQQITAEMKKSDERGKNDLATKAIMLTMPPAVRDMSNSFEFTTEGDMAIGKGRIALAALESLLPQIEKTLKAMEPDPNDFIDTPSGRLPRPKLQRGGG